MSFNLKADAGYKEVLIKRICYAITCSVLWQVHVLVLYLFIVNFSLDVMDWVGSTLYRLTSISTWLYFALFATIIVAQAVVCAKDYVVNMNYVSTRFRKILTVLSFHNVVLITLYVTIGSTTTCLWLTISNGEYKDLYTECKVNLWCLVEGKFMLVMGGAWSGAYFFFYGYLPKMSFSVIHQRKLLHFKASFFPLLRRSRSMAFWSTLYYLPLYYYFGSHFRDLFANNFGFIVLNEPFCLKLILFQHIFTVVSFFNLNLMQFFFELFLTEPISKPTTSLELLTTDPIPIVQHLESLDFYLLSLWSAPGRKSFFALSQPGGHPHVWNNFVQNVIKIIVTFRESLDASTCAFSGPEEKPTKSATSPKTTSPQSPLLKTPHKYSSIRNMSLRSPELIDFLPPTETCVDLQQFPSPLLAKLYNICTKIRNNSVLKYAFGEIPELKIDQTFSNGQVIVWTVQGLTNLVVASLDEDPYGVVQKDLPLIITSLIQLKNSLNKLNVALSVQRKDKISTKMRNNVNSAIKRCLCSLSMKFGKYLDDIPLSKDIVKQLQTYS